MEPSGGSLQNCRMAESGYRNLDDEFRMSNKQVQLMRKEYLYYIYIATNHPRNTVLYTGVTNSLFARSAHHKEKLYPNSFTARYNVNKIVYYEIYGLIGAAIYREKQIKGWTRKKKIELINSRNPRWVDVAKEMKSADD
ncbi:MAG: GIY-YIG nuclease family protein [Candidatus Falkowbacteria bacterium]